MADAFRRNEALKSFFEVELSNARMVKDDSKIVVLRALQSRHESGNYPKLQELFATIAPQSDLLLLAATDGAEMNKRPTALEKTADAVAFSDRALKTVALNLVVPILAIIGVGYICSLTADSITSIAKSAPPSVWTGFNWGVRAVTEVIMTHGLLLIAGLLAFVVFVITALPRWTGQWRLKADTLPGFSLYRTYHAAGVISALSMMLSSGKQLNEAIELLRARANPWLRWHLTRILTSLHDNPTDYNGAFGRGLMPKSIRARMASLASSSKGLGDVLETIGSTEIGKLETHVTRSAVTFNQTVSGGLVVLATVLSIGLMTISTAVSRESDPSKILQRKITGELFVPTKQISYLNFNLESTQI